MKKILVILTVIASLVLCSCEPPVSNISSTNNEPPVVNPTSTKYTVTINEKDEHGNVIKTILDKKGSSHKIEEITVYRKYTYTENNETYTCKDDIADVYTPIKIQYSNDGIETINKNSFIRYDYYSEDTEITVVYDKRLSFVPNDDKLDYIVEQLSGFNEINEIKIPDEYKGCESNPYIINVVYKNINSQGIPYDSAIPEKHPLLSYIQCLLKSLDYTVNCEGETGYTKLEITRILPNN